MFFAKVFYIKLIYNYMDPATRKYLMEFLYHEIEANYQSTFFEELLTNLNSLHQISFV